jgi:hypothetical protein
VWVEIVLVLVTIGTGNFIWAYLSGTARLGAEQGTWHTTVSPDGAHLTPAGYWYVFVCRTVFQFILLRWYFRLFIWARFLWQCSRLETDLIPTHPDRAAGLGFLAACGDAFSPFIVAQGALLSGLIANRIFYSGARLTDFKLEIIGAVVFVLLLVLGPLLVFSPLLAAARRKGLTEYGLLVSAYVRAFDLKWLRGGAGADEKLLGSGDIQSLADLGNSYQTIRDNGPFLFGRNAVVTLAVLVLLPVLPLVLTMIPLNELLEKLITAIL